MHRFSVILYHHAVKNTDQNFKMLSYHANGQKKKSNRFK